MMLSISSAQYVYRKRRLSPTNDRISLQTAEGHTLCSVSVFLTGLMNTLLCRVSTFGKDTAFDWLIWISRSEKDQSDHKFFIVFIWGLYCVEF